VIELISGAVAIDVNVDDPMEGLRGMERRAKKFAPAFKALRKPLREDQREHARDESGPDGKWPARSPKTIERLRARPRGRTPKGRRRRARKLRKLLGRLPSQLRMRFNGTGVWAISRVKWAQAHRDGATVARGSRLPARDFLWLSPKMIDVATETLVQHVYGGWMRRALGLRRM
jgi:phage gpG-like protein